jgi:hypothetical protein
LPTSGFTACQPAITDTAWVDIVALSMAPPPASFVLIAAIATIQAAVVASQERERVATLALKQERIMGVERARSRMRHDERTTNSAE